MRGKNSFAWRFFVIIVAYLSVMLAVVAYVARQVFLFMVREPEHAAGVVIGVVLARTFLRWLYGRRERWQMNRNL